jgi:hypothetical membrane protein
MNIFNSTIDGVRTYLGNLFPEDLSPHSVWKSLIIFFCFTIKWAIIGIVICAIFNNYQSVINMLMGR